jgi:small subunit ribosomal protein S6
MNKAEKHALYEAMFILPANITDDARAKLLDKIQNQLKENGGEIKKNIPMGKLKLAYNIEKHREGYYYLIYCTLPTNKMEEVKNGYNLNEEIVRYLFLSIEEIPQEIKFKPLVANN